MRKCFGICAVLLALVALIALVGCAEETPDSGYQLYYTVDMASKSYGDAIEGTNYLGKEERVTVVTLMNSLLAGPMVDGFVNPFPEGTSLLWFSQVERGIVRVNLSEEYNALTGMSLTLADYCIVRTLCQLDGVTGVEIYAANEPNPYRNNQILTLDDVT